MYSRLITPHLSDPPLNETHPIDTVANSSWSKESFFGLLAVILNIPVPITALPTRSIYRWWKLRQIRSFEGGEE
jgi:hypothetical protein